MCRFTSLSSKSQISFISHPFINSQEWYNADETCEESGGIISIIIITSAIIMILIIVTSLMTDSYEYICLYGTFHTILHITLRPLYKNMSKLPIYTMIILTIILWFNHFIIVYPHI